MVCAGTTLAPACAQQAPVPDGAATTAVTTASTTDSGGQLVAPLDPSALRQRIIERFGTPPRVPDGPLDADTIAALDTVFADGLRGGLRDGRWGEAQSRALERIAGSNDPRLAWLLADTMRISSSGALNASLAAAADALLGTTLPTGNPWGETVDHLIAWDVPAPPGYLDYKRRVYTLIEPAWQPLFVPGDIDWRHVSWGGVRIDDRAYDTTDEACNCIPAADNPAAGPATDADWLDDDAIVFGLDIGGEQRAYPRRIMEVREMVNDTLGGRDVGIPYCTLCGSAQAYFTDRLPEGVERPVLRTSGLLIRSNKVMYDLITRSVFDTFRGTAVTGALAERGVRLEQAGVVTTTWGAWKAEHPGTTVLLESLALGRDFDFRNGRDADGPIFPIGDVDPRLPVQEDVVGLISASGTPIAFQREPALAALRAGEPVEFENVRLVLEGDGLRAVDEAGEDLGGHQAFWFAWSQFHPGTVLWAP